MIASEGELSNSSGFYPPESERAVLVQAGEAHYTEPDGSGTRAVATIPLRHETEKVGALVAECAGQAIPLQLRIILEAVAAQAAGAMARIRAETALEHTQRQILEISDREHARIGQELHDGLCQQLVSLAFDANSLVRALSDRQSPYGTTAARLAHYLDEAITEARQISRGLFPVRLERDGLAAALEELTQSVESRFGVACRFTQADGLRCADAQIATNLYRIAQEAISNANRHSKARRITVDLSAGAEGFELRVADDGCGFDPRASRSGMGLHIMAYRARTIGGLLKIEPGSPRGTVVSCCAPVKHVA